MPQAYVNRDVDGANAVLILNRRQFTEAYHLHAGSPVLVDFNDDQDATVTLLKGEVL